MPTEEQKDRAWELVQSLTGHPCYMKQFAEGYSCGGLCSTCRARAIASDTKPLGEQLIESTGQALEATKCDHELNTCGKCGSRITDMDNKVIDYNDPGDSQ